MRKILINRVYGGFSLSALASKRYLELIGKECYFFTTNRDFHNPIYTEIPLEKANRYTSIFTVKNPNDYLDKIDKDLEEGSIEYNKAFNRIYNEIHFYYRDLERDDPILIQVFEELGEKANGECAELKIVEIPDDVEWEIDDYDGMESVEEKHNRWS